MNNIDIDKALLIIGLDMLKNKGNYIITNVNIDTNSDKIKELILIGEQKLKELGIDENSYIIEESVRSEVIKMIKEKR